MKKDLNEIEKIVVEVLGENGNNLDTSTSLPPIGQELQLVDVSAKTFYDRVTKEQAQANPMLKENEELRDDEHKHMYIAGTFKPSGVMSLGTLLRSPELKWDASLDTKAKRIQALQDTKLVFCCKETATSKNGRTYNIYHMNPITVGAPTAPKK